MLPADSLAVSHVSEASNHVHYSLFLLVWLSQKVLAVGHDDMNDGHHMTFT
jgi:hypothetical protein